MFSDSVELTICSGKGGAGSVSFRREKHVAQGGPDGGDGGKGGDVFFKVDRNSHTLANFKGVKTLKAKNGENGMGKRMTGKSGENLFVVVPPGTQVIEANSGRTILDLTDETDSILFLKGGLGGLGNWHFRSSTNQQPRYSQPGKEGISISVKLELKLIADVGLVGFPNVGKSTLISIISNAKPQIANYEFTTLTPKLGVVAVDEFNSFVMADIPGIIEGASDGRGLGFEFLKHIERTKFLLFMLDCSNYRTLEKQFETLKNELSKFSPILSKKKFAIAITKTDTLHNDIEKGKIDKFFEFLHVKSIKSSKLKNTYNIEASLPVVLKNIDDLLEIKSDEALFILPISSVTNLNIKALTYMLNNIVQKIENEEKNCN